MCDAVPACPAPATMINDAAAKQPSAEPVKASTPSPTPPSPKPSEEQHPTPAVQKPSTPLVNGRDSPKPANSTSEGGNTSPQKNGGTRTATPTGRATPTPSKTGATPKACSNETAADAAGGATPGTPTANFRAQFRAFSRFGDPKSDGKHLTLSQSDKWLKQARVIDGKKVTTTDTGIYFKKLKQQKLGMEDYKKFLEDLAKNKKIDVEEVKSKMASCGAPGLSSSSGASKTASTIDRLTDTSRYTGAHKQRFDESGKGKGIVGRKDVPDASGYVQGYQNKDTYNKTH